MLTITTIAAIAIGHRLSVRRLTGLLVICDSWFIGLLVYWFIGLCGLLVSWFIGYLVYWSIGLLVIGSLVPSCRRPELPPVHEGQVRRPAFKCWAAGPLAGWPRWLAAAAGCSLLAGWLASGAQR